MFLSLDAPLPCAEMQGMCRRHVLRNCDGSRSRRLRRERSARGEQGSPPYGRLCVGERGGGRPPLPYGWPHMVEIERVGRTPLPYGQATAVDREEGSTWIERSEGGGCGRRRRASPMPLPYGLPARWRRSEARACGEMEGAWERGRPTAVFCSMSTVCCRSHRMQGLNGAV
ncbi:hypothetical protein BRADI_2g25114v3 [Brachypodium distachyon]|uniref:Uncharacterized protein n=1 Tax=Brachypodium distachyon TaxID=15368 RepID=A0A2K2DAD3_BRADI|nr:hypothetical protein BRADI_2g25114v3 [Brachypodium distachyon]